MAAVLQHFRLMGWQSGKKKLGTEKPLKMFLNSN
jgi:hypothetical protein